MEFLITGANRGIGLELSRKLAGNGETVWTGYRQAPLPDALRHLQTEYPDQIRPVQIDVTDPGGVEKAAAHVRSKSGKIDCLINNAGIFPRGENPQNLNEGTLLRTFQTNTVGPMTVVREFLPLMGSSQVGKIINISSQLGSLERKTSGGNYSYCSSKAALNMLSRALAADLRRQGIAVIVVHPGWVQTDMGGSNASITPDQSATGIIKLIEKIDLSDSGKFFTWDGRIHPW